MEQPFYLFKPEYIENFIKLNKIYFVSQSYPRGQELADKVGKKSILLSDYDNIGLAKGHYAAIKHDPMASIIDLTNAKHLETVKTMLAGNSKYLVFWDALPNKQKFRAYMKKKYKDHIRRYISANTKWHIGRDELIESEIELEFGQFFMCLRRGQQMLRVPLEKIEEA